MKPSLKKFFLVSTGFLLPFFLTAQELWTLEKCISYALENNIQVKQYKLNADYQANIYGQSRAELLPSLNGSIDQNFVFGRSVNPYTNVITEDNYRSNNFVLSGSLNLFDGFQTVHNIKKNKFELMSSLQEVEKMKNDISLNIATAYLQILYNKEQLAISKNQLDITKQQIERTRKLVDAGTLPKGSLLEIEAQEANETLQVITGKNNVESALLGLRQTLELADSVNFDIAIPELGQFAIVQVSDSIDFIYNQALNLPQIKAAEYKVESSKHQLLSAKGSLSPRLSLGATFSTGYSNLRKKYEAGTPFEQEIGYLQGDPSQRVMTLMPDYNEVDYGFAPQLKDNASRYFSLRLTIPIFNNFQVKNAIGNSKIALDNSLYNLQLAKNQLHKEIQTATHQANASYAQYQGSFKAVEAMKESFKYTKQKFDLGLLNSVDYNLAKNNLNKAESELLQAKYQYIFRLKILDFYKGKPIVLE